MLPDLEKIFEGGVDARIGNERQSIVRQELCVLAQDCAASLQVLLEGLLPLVQFNLVLDKDYAFYLGLSRNSQHNLLFLHLKILFLIIGQ